MKSFKLTINKLTTQDINRIINSFNVEVINSSTVVWEGTNYWKLIDFVFNISEKAAVLIADICRTEIKFLIPHEDISSLAIGTMMGIAITLPSGESKEVYMTKGSLVVIDDKVYLEREEVWE